MAEQRGALHGVRILDLSRVWAGPLGTRILGDLGADVIRVEAIGSRGARTLRPEFVRASGRFPNGEAGERPYNREGMFNKFNRNKRAITLQLNTDAGRETFEGLVRAADVVLENYSPRVMPQLGLGYDRLSALNPAIIYIGMPGFGWTGPARDWVALGTMIEPAAGLSSLMGYAGGGPYKSGVAWADPVASLHAAAAVLIALHDRDADPEGRGQAIELAQMEGMICFIGEEILAAQVRGTPKPHPGNRHPFYAPQGVYRCRGEDRWIALSVTGDAQWRTICRLAGTPPSWLELRLDQRIEQHDAIDQALSAWAADYENHDLARRLQSNGIAAFPALESRELVEDPHLAARKFFPLISHPDAGTLRFPGFPGQLSETPATYRRPAPGLGEHNREVLQGILGLDDAALQALYEQKVIADAPPE